MSKEAGATPMHTYPCSQAEHIRRIVNIIDGNGDGKPGMRGEILLIKHHIGEIDKKVEAILESLSAKAQIDDEIEIERRVNVKMEQREKEKKVERDDNVKTKLAKRNDWRSFILVAIALLSFLFTMYKFNLEEKKANDKTLNHTEAKQ